MHPLGGFPIWAFASIAIAILALVLVMRRRAPARQPTSILRTAIRVVAGVLFAATAMITGSRTADRADASPPLAAPVQRVALAVPDAPIDRVQFVLAVSDRSGLSIARCGEVAVLRAGEDTIVKSLRGVTFTLRVGNTLTSLADVRVETRVVGINASTRASGSGGSSLALHGFDAGLPFDVLTPRAPIPEALFDPVLRDRWAMVLARPLRRGETLTAGATPAFEQAMTAALASGGGVAKTAPESGEARHDPLSRLMRRAAFPGSALLAFGVLLVCFNRRMPLTSTFAGLTIALASLGVLIRAEHRRHERDVHDAQASRAIAAVVGLASDVAYPSAAGRAADALLDSGAPDEVKVAALWGAAFADNVVAQAPETTRALDRATRHESAAVREAAAEIRRKNIEKGP